MAQFHQMFVSLNPCFNGRYSQSMEKKNVIESLIKVLILVLMEDTLRERVNTQEILY